MNRARYALYYAPRPEETLAIAARQWLGRNPESGETRALAPVDGLPWERLQALVAEPRRYGFHGTLKAPIALADGIDERDLLDAVGELARSEREVVVPAMRLGRIGDFFALVPEAPCLDLQALADRCVVEIDEFRRPADEAELARRRVNGLTPRQDELLTRWGYPYVLEAWRFHLTLTGRVESEREREIMMRELSRRFAFCLDRPLQVRDLCLFRQPAPDRPFTVMARFRLGGGRRVAVQVWRQA